MVQITGHRDKDGERFFNTPQEMAPGQALDHFTGELEFGGIITDIKNNGGSIIVSTRVVFMGCVDDTIFTGPVSEMGFIATLAQYHLIASRTSRSDAIKTALNVLSKELPQGKQGNPLLLSFFSGQATGKILLRLSAILAAGITNNNDLKLAAEARLSDVVAASQLAHEGYCSFSEALAL